MADFETAALPTTAVQGAVATPGPQLIAPPTTPEPTPASTTTPVPTPVADVATNVIDTNQWLEYGITDRDSDPCGFANPVALVQRRIKTDVITIAPGDYVDPKVDVRPWTQIRAGLDIVCMRVLPRDGSSVHCGFAISDGELVEDRQEPIIVTLVWPDEASEHGAKATPPIALFEYCFQAPDSDLRTQPQAADAPVVTRQALLTDSVLASASVELQAVYESMTSDVVAQSNDHCRTSAAKLEHYVAMSEQIKLALGIDRFWDPLPQGHVLDRDVVRALGQRFDDFRDDERLTSSAVDGSLDEMNSAVATSVLSLVRALQEAVQEYPEDDRGAIRSAEARLGAVATSRLRPDELVTVFTLALQQHCTPDQRNSDPVPPSVSDDPRAVCRLVSEALLGRMSFRDQLADGQNDRFSSNSISSVILGLEELYPAGDNPFFDLDSLRQLHQAELALGRFFVRNEAFDRSRVQGNEDRAQEVEQWAAATCPEIPADAINVPSVLDVAAPPDPGAVAEAQVRFCQSFGAMWSLRYQFRQAVPADGRSTTFDQETSDAFYGMIHAAQDMSDQLSAEHYLIAPDDDLPFDSSDLWDALVVERHVRHAYFAEFTVPINRRVLQRPEAGFVRIENHLDAMCDLVFDWSQPIASLPGPWIDDDLRGPFDETKADILFCPNLEHLTQAQAAWRERVGSVDSSDALDVEDAVVLQLRVSAAAGRHARLLMLLDPEIEHEDAFILDRFETQLRQALQPNPIPANGVAARINARGPHLDLIAPLCPHVDLSGFRDHQADLQLYESIVAAGVDE